MAYKYNRVKSTGDLELRRTASLAINRVTKVTKGGRTFTFAAIVVVGNEDGIAGWGLGKANEVTAAIAKAWGCKEESDSRSRTQRNHTPTSSTPNSAAHA